MNFIFVKSVKRSICYVKNLRLAHDLPITVNDRVLLPFYESFIFTKLRKFREIKTLAKISIFTVRNEYQNLVRWLIYLVVISGTHTLSFGMQSRARPFECCNQ